MAKLPPTPVGVPPGHSYWNDWYEKLRDLIDNAVQFFSDLDFTGSNITSIATRNHNDLQNFQGGTSAEYYHLTNAQHTALTAGFTGTGNLVRDTSPTLVTPVIGAATGTSLGVDGTGVGSAASIVSSSVNPTIALVETDGAADNKTWDFIANAEVLSMRAVNDANSSAQNWLTVNRTGTTIDDVTITKLRATGMTVGTGGATPTLSANKPGANTGVSTWLTLTINGTNYYIPLWT